MKSGKIEIRLDAREKTEQAASAISNQSTRQAVPLAVKRGLLVVDVNTGAGTNGRYGYVWHVRTARHGLWQGEVTERHLAAGAKCGIELRQGWEGIEWIIRSRKDTGTVVEIMALGSRLHARGTSQWRCGKARVVRRWSELSLEGTEERERGRGDFPLSSHKPALLPTICHRDFFSPILLLLFLPCSTAEDGDEV